MQNTSGVGYTPTFPLRTNKPYKDPLENRQGYTPLNLTLAQHAAVILGSAATVAVLNRPVTKLEHFYFLSDVPGESNRIFMSDKRAQFFRVLFGTNWLSGRSTAWGAADHAFGPALFLCFRDWLNERSGVAAAVAGTSANTRNGFIAGGATGAAYAALRHPYDVLRATAEAPNGPKQFRGAWDVLWTALRERPAVLTGLYRGISAVALGRSLQFGAQFGLYNSLRFDGVYRGSVVLFIYCHVAAFIGIALNYPFLAIRQQLRIANAATRGQHLTYRSLFLELRRRHGVTKVYDGFFSSRPWLNALAPAMVMFLVDVGTRRYTEYLHPARRQTAVAEQSLTHRRAPRHVNEPEPYEFKRTGE